MKFSEMTDEQKQEHVNNLNAENKQRREAVEQYDAAFSGLEPAVQQVLLHAVGLFSDDEKAGAARFQELAGVVLGDAPATAPTNTSVTDTPEGSTEMTDTPSPEMVALTALVEGLAAKIDTIGETQTTSIQSAADRETQIKLNQITALGYVEGSPEFIQLVDYLKISPDVAAADVMYKKMHDVVDPAVAAATAAAAAATVEGGLVLPEFPASAVAGTAAAPADGAAAVAAAAVPAPPATKSGIAEQAVARLKAITDANPLT